MQLFNNNYLIKLPKKYFLSFFFGVSHLINSIVVRSIGNSFFFIFLLFAINQKITMLDTLILLLFPLLVSFIGTFLLSQAILIKFNKLSLQGSRSSRSKKTRIYRNAGGLVLFVGTTLSLLLVVVLGFAPSPLFLKAIIISAIVMLASLKTEGYNLKRSVLLIFKILVAILLVALLQLSIPFVDHTFGFVLAVFFVVFCVSIITVFNLLERVAILFSIAATVFGAVLGVYAQDTVLMAANFSVMGSLIAFSYFNFSNTRKIYLSFTGELLIGFAIASQGLYLLKYGVDVSSFSNFLPFAFVIFLYPVCDVLQYFAIKPINKLFNKNIKALQIHQYFKNARIPKTNAVIIIAFALIQFFVLSLVMLNFGFMQ